MVKCGDDCRAACDFCIHYAFNGEPVRSADGRTVALACTGRGHCHLYDRQVDPGSCCPDFHCRLASANLRS